ncbi:hypothetical protein OBBRIDRAFT_57423 [Obba rivulosa]|uniref:Uncharacterized protein n=1 Tax=Obba rivulosa TaxID=1052685 RepID=A0A8E2AVL1_9APHY|nr:hypothetical protein OBBRIDRAFT_57423 [Obba rivulosa]
MIYSSMCVRTPSNGEGKGSARVGKRVPSAAHLVKIALTLVDMRDESAEISASAIEVCLDDNAGETITVQGPKICIRRAYSMARTVLRWNNWEWVDSAQLSPGFASRHNTLSMGSLRKARRVGVVPMK